MVDAKIHLDAALIIVIVFLANVQTRSIPAPPSHQPSPFLSRIPCATLSLCPPISQSSTTRLASLPYPPKSTHPLHPLHPPAFWCAPLLSLSCRSLILSFPLSWRSFPTFPSFSFSFSFHHPSSNTVIYDSNPYRRLRPSISTSLSLATYIPPPNIRPSLTLVERDLRPHSCPRRESVPVAIQARCHHYTTTYIDDNKTKTNEHYIPAHPSHTLNPTPTLASQTIFNHRSVKDKHLQSGQIPQKSQCPSQA
jgi:hypothetical protein